MGAHSTGARHGPQIGAGGSAHLYPQARRSHTPTLAPPLGSAAEAPLESTLPEAFPQDAHFFNAALRWPGMGATPCVTMPGGLSQEGLMAMLRLRYGRAQGRAGPRT